MRRLYRAILNLYPAEYRGTFASEMVIVFDRANRTASGQGFPKLTAFAIHECIGLLKGLMVEHTAKWWAQDGYITPHCTEQQNSELLLNVIQAEHQLQHLLRSMERAIAHHDFPLARFYSAEEHKTRALLERLRTNETPRVAN